jgi:hypothetical protein
VKCPILNKFICLGCCIDLAGICTSAEISEHPFVADLDRAAHAASVSIHGAQITCLRHQLELLPEQSKAGIQYEAPFEYIEQHLKWCLALALERSSHAGDEVGS